MQEMFEHLILLIKFPDFCGIICHMIYVDIILATFIVCYPGLS